MDVNILAIDENDRVYVRSDQRTSPDNSVYPGKLFYTDDEGITWDSIPIPSEDSREYYTEYTMTTYKNDVVITAEGYAYDVIFYSNDWGANFKELPIIHHNYRNIKSAYNSKGELYVLLKDSKGEDTLLISKDQCATFISKKMRIQISSKLRFDKNDYLYAIHGYYAHNGGFYVRSTNEGDDWEYVVDTNNIKLKANCIYFDDKNQAFLGTIEDGVWKADVVKGIPVEYKSNQLSLEISPNPASERATITVSQNTGPAEITIYNQLGEIVYRTQHRGENGEIVIPVEGFPQGAYFVKLSANGEVMTGKFAVVK